MDLGGQDWRVASSNGSISAAASVPGVIHLDLLVRPPKMLELRVLSVGV